MSTNRTEYVLQGFIADEKLNKQYCLLARKGQRYKATLDEVRVFAANGNNIQHAIITDTDIKIDSSYKKRNYLGQTIGNWQVEEYYGMNDKNSYGFWLCTCLKCNKKHLVAETSFTNNESSQCNDCRRIQYKSQSIKINNFTDEVYAFISSVYDKTIICNADDILDAEKLSMYLPDKQLAIQCNANSTSHDQLHYPKYHINKSIECAKHQIRLIHIYEYEWLSKKEKLKTFLIQQLDIDIKTVYARKCTVNIIDNTFAMDFCNKYHLQKAVAASVCLGLFYENDLIEVMTFGRPRFNCSEDWELIRLCTKTGYKIIGGASKLFKFFIKRHPDISVISYADLAKFTGTVYNQLGMRFIRRADPNYVYVKDKTILTRYQCQKHKLVAQGFDEYMTEYEIMLYRGFNRIYDCGNAVYIYEP